MLLYFSIPEGMDHVPKTINENGDELLHDFLKGTGKTDIDLQAIAKECLRLCSRGAVKAEHQGLTIYFKKPPLEDRQFLEYLPNNNGKSPSTKVQVVNGLHYFSRSSGIKTHYGQRWFQEVPLSDKKYKEVMARDERVRHDRRHDGDTPKAT